MVTAKTKAASQVAPQPAPGRGWCFLAGLGTLLIWLCLGAHSYGDTTVTPNASPEAQALLTYLHDIHGKKMLSGQQRGWRGTNELGFELEHIQKHTGKLPAILGLEAAGLMGGRGQAGSGPSVVAKQAMDWYSHRNGIVTFCWHWNAPVGKHAFYTKDTDFDVARAVTPGTPEYAGVLHDLDAIAEQLKLLQAAQVPVLWRPLHEANGRWFWWGAAGPEACVKLWRLMFERFTAHHGLTNLVWVFSPGANLDLAAWYPGDAYVDIIGQDHYPLDGNHGAAKDIYDELLALGGGAKLVGMSENGPIPDPTLVATDKVKWLFFVTWNGEELTKYNSPAQLKEFYNHPWVENLSDVPKLKDYPFQAAGKAVKLSFASAPGDFGIASPARRPIAVLVQDADGRTVRSGSYVVTLTGEAALGEQKLSATTVNGVATFPELTLARAIPNVSLTATAIGLQSAQSAEFSVGPGSGVLRESWVVSPGTEQGGASTKFQETVCKAFEVPVQPGTNFHSRFRALLIPPQTGVYRFWIANDDRSELWLSPEATATNMMKIAAVSGETPYAKWPHTKEAASVPVRLEAGKRYHLQVIQAQHAGSTHLSVRWQLPDGAEERPIPVARLALPDSMETNKKLTQANPLNP
ncbi:MAG: glycosyl hydrolase [Verrucomicrobiota bacterium]